MCIRVPICITDCMYCMLLCLFKNNIIIKVDDRYIQYCFLVSYYIYKKPNSWLHKNLIKFFKIKFKGYHIL